MASFGSANNDKWRRNQPSSSYSRASNQSKFPSRSMEASTYRPKSGAPYNPLPFKDERVLAPGRFDLRPNGELCLDDMRRGPAPRDAFVDPLTLIWSMNQRNLDKYMKYLGLHSIEQSKAIVRAMNKFQHWMGGHLFLDNGQIFDQPAKPGQYKYGDDSVHFYSNISDKLVETAVISYFRYINVGDYYENAQPQPNEGEGLSYINREKNYMFLGRTVGLDLKPYFAMDNEASYSVSDGMRANQMTTLLTKFIRPGGMVIDMTACVGGNTIAFADSFHVRSQEIDSLRYTLLRYNCWVAKVPINRYLVWHVDSLALFNEPGSYSSDCVYCDPPWGGPEYVDLPEMDLTLGNMDLIDIALNCLRETKVFMCRTTFNYNRNKFNQAMDENGYRVYTYVTYKQKDQSRPLFYLLFVTKESFKPYNSQYSEGSSLFKYLP